VTWISSASGVREPVTMSATMLTVVVATSAAVNGSSPNARWGFQAA
jgi:hypothetical protein